MSAYPSLAAKWAAKTQPGDGGHLLWTGSVGAHGNPILDYRGRRHMPCRIAYQMRTGRPPNGPARPSCGIALCVAPRHVDDAGDRYRDRLVLRVLRGLPLPPDRCGAEHDQAVHGRFRTDGRHYCQECQRERKAAA